MDIVFENIVYPVESTKILNPILRSVNGQFSSGQLTGVVGRSGAGKTTLLNVLARQISTNLGGTVRINGTFMDTEEFKKTSSYVVQDVLLESYLTVKEYMMVSADLLLSPDIMRATKEEMVIDILKSLDMHNLMDSRTEHLSGGERKRLSIALELVNDPRVILLDEPTSGLDNVAAKECMEILKDLATRGKIVICSIHQPSDSIFCMFDRVYFINDGNCIYDGAVQGLLPFLEDCGYSCPKTHNPADYILELDDAAYQMLNERTSSVWNERKRVIERSHSKSAPRADSKLYSRNSLGLSERVATLLRKNFIQLRRKKTAMAINVFHHLLCSLGPALLAMNTGNNAERALDNFKFGISNSAYFQYAYLMVPVLTLPAITKVIKRDVRNGWYTPLPYLLSEVLTSLPAMVVLTTFVATVVYSISFAEIDLRRTFLLSVIFMLTAFSANILGLCIGTLFNAKNGAAIASFLAVVQVVGSIAGMGAGQVNLPTRILRQLMYVRYSLVGNLLALYGGREKLECPGIFCPYASVERYLKDMGFEDNAYSNQVLLLLFHALLLLFVYYLIVRIRFRTNAGS